MLHQLLPIVLFLGAPDGQTSHVMDGRFDDWAAPTVLDGPAGAMIQGVRVADDPHFVYLQIDLERPATLQGLDRELRIELDLDANDRTGVNGSAGISGVDAVVLFSPRDEDGSIRSGAAVLGIRGESITRTTPDALEVVAMPTHGSDRFEIRLRRAPAFRGGAFEGQLLTVTRDGTQSATPAFEHEFESRASNAMPKALTDPAAPAEGVRIMSWNGERGALFKAQVAGAFMKTFEAVLPDVVLLQELPAGAQEQQLTQWFERLKGDEDWSAVVSGGSLPVAVLSRHPMMPVEELVKVQGVDPRGSKRFVRAVGGLTTIEGRTILTVCVHLKCCGRLGSSEDEKRRIEVDGIHEAVRLAVARLKPDEVVIGGDLNLVGTRAVLTRLQEGLAPDGGDLVVTDPIRPAGDAITSWEKPGQAFVPGRLDFLLVGGAGAITRAVVIDPAQMDERWRRRHGIPAAHPSDHLPILVDVDLTP